MHHMTFSMQIGIVDQVQFGGAGVPGAIALDLAVLDRAGQLGRNVAEQAGRSFDEVEYRGNPGLCPMCHLDLVVLRDAAVECAVCGAEGELVVQSGNASVRFSPEGLERSVLSIAEKEAHFVEVQETAVRQFALVGEIEERAAPYRRFDRVIRPAARLPT